MIFVSVFGLVERSWVGMRKCGTGDREKASYYYGEYNLQNYFFRLNCGHHLDVHLKKYISINRTSSGGLYESLMKIGFRKSRKVFLWCSKTYHIVSGKASWKFIARFMPIIKFSLCSLAKFRNRIESSFRLRWYWCSR